MLQIANWHIEGIKALHACNRLVEGVPLDYRGGGAGEGVSIIIPGSADLPKSHGVTVPWYSITVLFISRKGYGNQTMYDFVKSLLQCSSYEILYNPSYTRLSIEITDCPVSSSSLDWLNLGYPHLGMRVPHSRGIFQLWPNQGIVCRFTDIWHLCLNVPPDKAKCPVCTAYYSVNVGIPWETTGDVTVPDKVQNSTPVPDTPLIPYPVPDNGFGFHQE